MSAVPQGAASGDPQIAALRVPPHSIEAEQAVLGGLLLDNTAFDRVADLLREDDFYRYDHRLIWHQIGRLIERSHPADVVTVYEALKVAGKDDDAGGLVYLNALAQETPSAANIRRYAEIVRDRAVLRKLISTADDISTSALNPSGKDTRQLLDEAESKVFQISEDGARGQAGFQPLPDLLGKVVERIGENCEPALATVLFVGGAGGSLRAGVTENPVLLTRSIKDLLTSVSCGGAPAYVWPGGGITVMVDVTRMPAGSFGSVPTPAIVAPIEFTMPRDVYAALGGHVDRIRTVADVVERERHRVAAIDARNPWPLAGRGEPR